MAFTGPFDVISLALALKLFMLSVAAAFTDSWHPNFYSIATMSTGLVLILVTVFMAMLMAVVHLVALCLAIFVTEALRKVAMAMAAGCAFFHALALTLYAHSLLCLTSPWLLVMLTSPLSVLSVHQILVHLKRLDDCPLYKFVTSVITLLMCILSLSLRHWWSVDAGARQSQAHSVGLFAMSAGTAGSVLQAFAILATLTLLCLAALSGLVLAQARDWLQSTLLGDTAASYLFAGLSMAALLHVLCATFAFCSITYYTNSLLAAVSLFDSALCLVYQLFSAEILPVQ